jgi:hypothetical protein
MDSFNSFNLAGDFVLYLLKYSLEDLFVRFHELVEDFFVRFYTEDLFVRFLVIFFEALFLF